MEQDQKAKTLFNAVGGTLSDAAKARKATLGGTGLAPGLDENPAMTKESQRSASFHRIYVRHKRQLQEIAFNELDAKGNRRSLTELMDEALELFFLCRRLVPMAELRGTTPHKLVEEWVENQLSPKKRGKSEPTEP